MRTTKRVRMWTRALGLAAVTLLPVGAQAQEEDSAESREEALVRMLGAIEAADDAPSILRSFDPRRATAAERKAVRVLKTTRLAVDFQAQPLEEVLRTLHVATGLTFVASARATEAARDAELKVTFAVDGLPLENALNLLAFSLRDYRFVLRYGAVVLVKTEEAKARRTLRIYDVSDLVRPRPDFPAPPLGLDTGREPGR